MTSVPRAALARDFYLAYLNSPAWRQRRNAKLRDVGWKCERCPSKRNLQVHHKTYDRLGAERDTDIEVLCADCHEQHHIDEREASPLGVYIKLARVALREHPWATIADLSEETKRLCVLARVPYDGPEIHRALQLLTGTRIQRPAAPAPSSRRPESVVLNEQETHELLRRLLPDVDLSAVIKTMPEPRLADEDEARIRQQLADMRRELAHEQLSRHRKSAEERINEIFATRPW